MAAKARALLFSLAAFCLPAAFANIPRQSPVAEKPHPGSANFALASHRADTAANTSIATGFGGCVCDEARRSRSSGKERDAETGLDYFGARYMSAAQGRFTSPDSPLIDQYPEDPQSWNLYAYVRNRPLTLIDADGKAAAWALNGFNEASKIYSGAPPGVGKILAGVGVVLAGAAVVATVDRSDVGAVWDKAVSASATFKPAGTSKFGIAGDGGFTAYAIEADKHSAQAPTNDSKAPDFVVTPGGDAIPIPNGASGPNPVVNKGGNTTGASYTGGSGGKGLDPKVSGVRIMNPTPPNAASPGYPNGYVTYQNPSGQGVNPQTGKTVSNSDPSRHIPLNPPKPCPGGGSCQ